MSGRSDIDLLGKAFGLLANGFAMAANSGIDATLRRIDDGTDQSPYAAGLPRVVRVSFNGPALSLGRFYPRLSLDLLIEAIGKGDCAWAVADQAGSVSIGDRDEPKSYELARVAYVYADTDDGFALDMTMTMGAPVRGSFMYTASPDRSHERYGTVIRVPFADIFKFRFPVTKIEAEAIITRIAERRGITVARPPFFVSN